MCHDDAVKLAKIAKIGSGFRLVAWQQADGGVQVHLRF